MEEVRALIDESQHTPRYELIDGELLVSFPTDERGVTSAPSWTHQAAVSQLLQALATYLARQPVGHVLLAPADVQLEPESLVQPDVFVLPLARGEPFSVWHAGRGLLLAVEVLSPSTARYDRVVKCRFFQRVGVPEYWIVDTDARVVERWCVGDERPELLDAILEWHPDGADAAFSLELAGFFARVHRDAPT